MTWDKWDEDHERNFGVEDCEKAQTLNNMNSNPPKLTFFIGVFCIVVSNILAVLLGLLISFIIDHL